MKSSKLITAEIFYSLKDKDIYVNNKNSYTIYFITINNELNFSLYGNDIDLKKKVFRLKFYKDGIKRNQHSYKIYNKKNKTYSDVSVVDMVTLLAENKFKIVKKLLQQWIMEDDYGN